MTRKQEVISFGFSMMLVGSNATCALMNIAHDVPLWVVLFCLVGATVCAYDAGTAYKRITEEDHAG